MANTYAGEIGVMVGEREYLFRPSLRAIASLGNPREIISDYLMKLQEQPLERFSDNPWIRFEQEKIWQSRLYGLVQAAIRVMHACYVGNDDADWRLTGYYDERRGKNRWVMGLMPPKNLHVIGTRLLINGVVGDPKPRKGDKSGPAREFNPAEYVALAQAHLGMSGKDAWDMTMIELQRALDAKFPPDDKANSGQPTVDEAEAMFAHVARIRSNTIH